MALNIDPPEVTFPAAGGSATVNILNETEGRLSFKVIFASIYILNYDFKLRKFDQSF